MKIRHTANTSVPLGKKASDFHSALASVLDGMKEVPDDASVILNINKPHSHQLDTVSVDGKLEVTFTWETE